SDLPGNGRVAPRMDLVVAQCAGGEPPSIAFWEAKCATNSELRANGTPRVLDQVQKYVCWMAEVGRIAQVQQAYRDTATTLLALHRLFCTEQGGNPEALRIWQALAKLESPVVAVRPGIVV